VIGKGVFSVVESDAEREAGFQVIMEHYTGRRGWTFDPALMKRTAIYRLEVEDFPLTVIIDSLGNDLYKCGPENYLESIKPEL
jgi:hypothetical protein